MTTQISLGFCTCFSRTIWSVPYMKKWQPDTPAVIISPLQVQLRWTLSLSQQDNFLSYWQVSCLPGLYFIILWMVCKNQVVSAVFCLAALSW